MLHGRATERSVIDRLLARARVGRSGALVIRGDAGIGKTALLDYAEVAAGAVASGDAPTGDAASGCAAPDGVAPDGMAPPGVAGIRVIRGAGVQSEADLPFAGLHLLLGPALDRRSTLPQPQRDALDAVFGLRARSCDTFLVGIAALSLLAMLAENRPLVCLVDDAHWLDRASAEALVFAARRLGAGGISIIFAARDHDAPFPAPGLPELQVGGLGAAAAMALVMEHGGDQMTTPARDLILATACGNPLGLIELSAAHVGAAPATARPGPGALALTDRLRKAFDGQVRRLAEPEQTLLLAAAAEDSGDLGVVLEAAGALGVVVGDLGAAEQAGIIRLARGTVTFRHPLVRAAVYQRAPLARRLAVHRALADAPRDPADADRRTWHLAAMATGPDEQIAAELERTATKAKARGGHTAAAAVYERAVQLSADPAAQARRLVLAAGAAAEIGDFDRARGLSARVAGRATDPIAKATLAGVGALAEFAQGRLPAAHRLLVEGAASSGEQNRPRSLRLLMNALHIAWLLGDRALIADTADRLKVACGPGAEPLAPLVRLMLRVAVQPGERMTNGLPGLADMVAEARRSRVGHRGDLAMIAMACSVTGRDFDARDLTAGLAADARAQGSTGSLPTLLTYLAQALVFEGRHRDALASAGEALRIAQDIGHVPWTIEANAIMAYLAAVGGDQARCRRLVDAALATYATWAGTPWAPWALGLLDLGRGRLDSALVRLETIFRGPARHHRSAMQCIPDLVEAAVRLGQPRRAAKPLARFSQWAQRADASSSDALVERCQALVAGEDAEPHYLAALKLHDESFEQARTQLLYGAWLRRRRRKYEARTQLRAAMDYLDRIGAGPWAERARAELSATGATGTTTPRASRAGLPGLTPQELQVTQLAARGLSNRDIAARLFLSPRTVGYHLYKAYPKLGVTSRGELDPATLPP